ncbi:hypothetical protein GA0115249_107525 [Streptomyces sp. PpalLS-921]|nr:hypothetical protein GA0115249_107525 [Streptomyces sp. PpalLS-921]
MKRYTLSGRGSGGRPPGTHRLNTTQEGGR